MGRSPGSRRLSSGTGLLRWPTTPGSRSSPSGRLTHPYGAAQHWLAPLQRQYPRSCLTGHHAAAVAIGRRGLAQRARRRGTHARRSPGDGLRATVRSSAGGAIDGVSRSLGDHPTNRGPGPRTGRRRPPDGAIRAPRGGGSKTTMPTRSTGDQVAQDRSGPPGAQGSVLLTVQERCQYPKRGPLGLGPVSGNG